MDIDDLEGEGGGHIAPLTADTIPDANQAHYCFSCEEPITGVYCAGCGQKNDDFRRSIFSLVIETFSTMFGFESRIWRTWLTLLTKPGLVAREYADGARTKWSSPVRVYIAMSIILFGFLSCSQTQIFSIDIDAERKDGAPTAIEDMAPDDVSIKFSAQMFVRQSEIDARNETRNFELLELWLRDGMNVDIGTSEDPDSVDGDAAPDENSASPDAGPDATMDPPAGGKPEREGSTIQLTDALGNKRTLTSSQYAPIVLAIIRNPEIINRGLFKNLPRVMFFMMPFCMLLGALFIRGKRALLFDHLVHAAYIHAVTFLVILFGVIVGIFWKSPVFNLVLLGGLVLYLPLSLKRMFGRGWFKTVLTSYTVGFNYILTIFVVIIFILLSDVSSYADSLYQS